MGGSSWNDAFYATRATSRVDAGVSAFAYSDSVKSGSISAKTHEDLDPKGVIRESRDSEDHPNSNAIGVMFDVTGSMGGIPVELQKKLPSLLGVLTRKGYIPDPQILFGAIGDYRARDVSPLQVGQFESGNEMEDDLEKVYLEGSGGGNMGESYDLAMWFFANKTKIDCLEKRGDKGYLFTIGDEPFFDTVRKVDVKAVFGDDLQADIPLKEVVEQLQEKYHYFHIIPSGGYRSSSSKDGWTKLLGQNVLILDDSNAVCETIAMAIGVNEDSIDIDNAVVDLAAEGYDAHAIASATRAVATIAGNRPAVVSGQLPAGDSEDDVARL